MEKEYWQHRKQGIGESMMEGISRKKPEGHVHLDQI